MEKTIQNLTVRAQWPVSKLESSCAPVSGSTRIFNQRRSQAISGYKPSTIGRFVALNCQTAANLERFHPRPKHLA
jgi:hypothetical protein